MQKESFIEQFQKETEIVRGSFRTDLVERDRTVRDAYDDLSLALGLTYPCIALLAWALGNTDSRTIYTDGVATLIGYAERDVNVSLDELVVRGYLARVETEEDSFDVTEESKELVFNHYCFGKLIYTQE